MTGRGYLVATVVRDDPPQLPRKLNGHWGTWPRDVLSCPWHDGPRECCPDERCHRALRGDGA